ncbi:MAG TPA: carbohydrate ABC transporter permease [Erysipelotrichaceae bacterium]|nr:carbohydrate ABC transporter permease [Erysipelotrichaceae bacterium]
MILNNDLKRKKKKRTPQWYIGKIVAYGVLVITGILYLIPFLFALSTSFTSPANIYQDFQWIPKPIDLVNYSKFFSEHDIVRAFINTILYVSPPILVGVMASALAAYAFARINFKGKNIVFYCLLATIVIPGVITMVPSYVLFTNFYRWTGTPLPIIIPGMFGSAMTMFFLNQFFKTLPKELEEAAEIDGMSKIGIFFKIILPLSVPAFITQIILSFNGCYNDYLGPLLYLGSSPKLWTVQLVVASTQTALYSPYTLMMAAAITALLPTLILYIFCQKYFIEGIAMTGLK